MLLSFTRRLVRVLCGFILIGVAVLVPSASGVAAQEEVASWQPGPDGAGSNTYLGFVEQPSDGLATSGAPFVISGWLVDKTAQGWAGFDQVQIYNGAMGSVGTLLASADVGLDRPDVASATGNPFWSQSGFIAQVPGSALQPGAYALQLYGHTPAKGWWYTTFYLAVGVSATGQVAGAPTLSINRPSAEENIPATKPSYTVSGSAADPQAGAGSSGIDQVAVYLNGPRGDPHAAFLGNASITGTDWSLTFSPNLYQWGPTSLYVYARSQISGQETQKVQFFSIS